MANTKIPSELSSTPSISDSGDATAITIDSSERVGIGTTSPSVPLTVNNQTDHSDIAIFHAGGGTPNRGLKISTFSNVSDNAGVELDAQFASGGAFKFSTGGTERVRIKNDGKVGIGTTDPNALLTVNGGNSDYTPDSSGTGLFHVRGGASSLYTAYIGVDDNGVQIGHTGNNRYLRFDTNETARMTILSDGKVGIGLTAPTKALEINDTSEVDGIQLRVKGDSTRGGTMEFRRGDSFTWRIGCGGASSTNSNIPASYFGIEDGGNNVALCVAHTTYRVGIGLTNPSNKFHIKGSSGEYVYYHENGNGNFKMSHGNGSFHHFYQNGASSGFYFGSACQANGGFSTYSDERLKENITTIDSALDKVALMNGVSFTWIDTEKRGEGKQFGVTAQNMLEVDAELPKLVEDADATNEEIANEKINTQYYSMDYARLTPFFIEAIKELKTELDAAKARITTLEG